MDTEFVTVAGAVISLIQISKYSLLGSADALDELSRRRPLQRFKDLRDAAGPESPLQPLLQVERGAELFRQVFGKSFR